MGRVQFFKALVYCPYCDKERRINLPPFRKTDEEVDGRIQSECPSCFDKLEKKIEELRKRRRS